jgi:hypothetical protein
MSPFARTLFLFLLALPFPVKTQAGEPKKGGDTPVLKKFSVAKNGDALLLPVLLNDKKYFFIVDTGSNVSVFDTSFPLGDPVETKLASTPDGVTEIKMFNPPAATVGGLPMPNKQPVVKFDLSKIREMSGQAIHGIIGMDFLKDHIVQIDFENGEFVFLKTLPTQAGSPFTLHYHGGLPHLSVQVHGLQQSVFALDSGNLGFGTGDLNTEMFDLLVSKKELDIVGKTLFLTASGTKLNRIGRSAKLSLGKFALVNPMFGEGADNSLGLTFLSRFTVTFDFPDNKIYLRTGKLFDQPDVWDLSGLNLIRKKGKTMVYSVDKDSPAALAGIKGGEQILRVGNRKMEDLTLREFRRLCAAQGASLQLTLAREKETMEVTVVLKP